MSQDLNNLETQLMADAARLESEIEVLRRQLRDVRIRKRIGNQLHRIREGAATRSQQMRQMNALRERGYTWKQISELMNITATRINHLRNPYLIRQVELQSKKVTKRTKLSDMYWSVRTFNVFGWNNIETVAQLCEMTPKQLLMLRNCGNNSLAEIQALLSEHGMKLADEP